MTHRERLVAALNHKESDMVPLDFGGAGVTTINVNAYENLKRFLGINCDTVILNRKSGGVEVDEAILQRLDIDTRILSPKAPSDKNKEYSDGSFADAWGVRWSPTGVGTYHVTESPFQTRFGQTEIDEYPWPEAADLVSVEGLRQEAEKLHEETDFGVVLNLPVGVVHITQFLRGYENWLMDMVDNSVLVEALFEKVLGVWIDVAREILEEAGKFSDVVFWGDDIAFQDCTVVSPELYRTLIKPYHKRMCKFVKSMTEAKIMFHSCGAVYPLIPDLIEMGVDALNPVQVSAKGMNPSDIKREFGDSLSLWGAIDTHHVLNRGTAEDVRTEVKERVKTLSKSGGYVLASVHNILQEVPPENIVAMFEAGREFGKC